MPPLPAAYRLVRALVRGLLRLFFREIAVEGRRHVPAGRGGVLVAWHPNGLIDPALILARFPAHVVFGARDGLLRWPVLGALMRALGTVPIYRPQDAPAGEPEAGEAARRAANQKSLDALAAEVAAGRYAALFPEGHSHDEPGLTPLRSGAARLYARALALTPPDRPPPTLVPVGLHYDAKAIFRSTALVAFHAPLDVPDALRARLVDADAATARAAADELTARVERGLVLAVHPSESWALHATMHRARALMWAEHAARTGERLDASPAGRTLGFAQIWHGYQARRATHPGEVAALRRDVDDYARLLDAARLADADLDAAPRVADVRLGALLGVQAVGVFVLLPPVLGLGYAVNGPPHLFLKWLAPRLAGMEKDTATVKLFAGMLLYPLTWVAAGGLAALGHVRLHAAFPALPAGALWTGVAVFVLSAVGAALALRYSELAAATVRAVRVRLTRARRRDTVARLRARRADLFDRLVTLKEGVPLPQTLTDPVGRTSP